MRRGNEKVCGEERQTVQKEMGGGSTETKKGGLQKKKKSLGDEILKNQKTKTNTSIEKTETMTDRQGGYYMEEKEESKRRDKGGRKSHYSFLAGLSEEKQSKKTVPKVWLRVGMEKEMRGG